jgi:DNA-binding MarR family transcriptional regulator
LVTRHESAADRRCLTLALTANGETIVNAARVGAQAKFSEILGGLAKNDLETVQRALEILRPLFMP